MGFNGRVHGLIFMILLVMDLYLLLLLIKVQSRSWPTKPVAAMLVATGLYQQDYEGFKVNFCRKVRIISSACTGDLVKIIENGDRHCTIRSMT